MSCHTFKILTMLDKGKILNAFMTIGKLDTRTSVVYFCKAEITEVTISEVTILLPCFSWMNSVFVNSCFEVSRAELCQTEWLKPVLKRTPRILDSFPFKLHSILITATLLEMSARIICLMKASLFSDNKGRRTRYKMCRRNIFHQ